MGLDEHRVRERAYYIWEDEGRAFGRADAHWLRAESELRAGPDHVHASAEAVSLAPSPAKVLKTRGSRAKATAEAVFGKTAKPTAKSATKSREKPSTAAAAKVPAAKTSTTKPAAAKAPAPRGARKAATASVALH